MRNFGIQMCHQNEPKFKGAYSRDNLSDTVNDVIYVVTLDEK